MPFLTEMLCSFSSDVLSCLLTQPVEAFFQLVVDADCGSVFSAC